MPIWGQFNQLEIELRTDQDDVVEVDGLTGLNLKLLGGNDYIATSLMYQDELSNIFVDLGSGDDQAFIDLGKANIQNANFEFEDSMQGDSNLLELTDLTARSSAKITMSEGEDRIILNRSVASGADLDSTKLNIEGFNINHNDQFILRRSFGSATIKRIHNEEGLLSSALIRDSAYGKITINFDTPFLESSSESLEDYILLNQ